MRLIDPRPEHAERMMAWRQEPQGRRDNPYDDVSLEVLRERLVRPDLHDAARVQQRWMVEVGEEVVGSVSIHSLNLRMRHAEVGYVIGDAWKGRGYATAALRLLVPLAWEAGLRRLMALVAAENLASQRVLQKVGFTREGLLRRHFLIEGREVDEVVFGLLREEWE